MIGIFDSGVGGMTVARAIERLLPERQLLYFGDLARTPYGTKSPETIVEYSIQNTEFLLSKGAQLVVIACNSASSVAADILRSRFSVPIFEVIAPAIEEAVRSSRSGRIGVIGTNATIRSGVYEREIKRLAPHAKVFSVACPLLVPLVEEGWLNKQETKMIVRRYLHGLRQKQIDTLVLGCTHYPLLKHLIQPKIGRLVQIIDSSEVVAGALQSYLSKNPLISNSLATSTRDMFHVSDWTPAAERIAHGIFGRSVQLLKTRGGGGEGV